MRKKNKKISEISFKDIKSYIQQERYKIKKDISDFTKLPEKIYEDMNPVFVVSTGRVGSELLVKLMKKTKIGSIYHEPYPRMFLGSKIAYEMDPEKMSAKKMAFLNARYFLLKTAYLHDKRFIETNNRTTFFMDAIAEIFPKAKFIHIIRHPGGFVRSGLRRNYYIGNENDDGRLTPRMGNPISTNWEGMKQIEKISWLWNETNSFIEKKKNSIQKERILTMFSTELFTNPNTFQLVCEFLECEALSTKHIENIIKKPINKQKQGHVGKWETWSENDISLLKEWTPLGREYGFWSESK